MYKVNFIIGIFVAFLKKDWRKLYYETRFVPVT